LPRVTYPCIGLVESMIDDANVIAIANVTAFKSISTVSVNAITGRDIDNDRTTVSDGMFLTCPMARVEVCFVVDATDSQR